MKPLIKKFIPVWIFTFVTCLLLGYLTDLIFGIKMYQAFVFGGLVTTINSYYTIKNKTVKKQ
jgi:ABC-type iron transport system FetAB permease component